MPLERNQIKEVLDAVAPEGNAQLQIAPVSSLNRDCPAQWRYLLTQEEAGTQLLSTVWEPLAEKLPRTRAAWKRILRGVAYLTTAQRPPSLVYFYQQDKKLFAYRGYAPTELRRPEASIIPPVIAEFYRVHNGFVDLFSWAMGPLPESDWHSLGEDPAKPSGSFLVLFSNGGGASVGFDLSEQPPLSYIVWPDDPPTLVPDFWATIDEWIATGLADADPA